MPRSPRATLAAEVEQDNRYNRFARMIQRVNTLKEPYRPSGLVGFALRAFQRGPQRYTKYTTESIIASAKRSHLLQANGVMIVDRLERWAKARGLKLPNYRDPYEFWGHVLEHDSP